MSSLDSAIRILQCLSPERPRLRVSEVAEHLKIPKSTVSRLLKSLSEGGVLDRDEDTKEYVAGPVSLQLGGLYMAKHNLLDLVDDAVRRLVDRFGFTGYVAVLDRGEAVVLRCRHGGYPLKFVLEVGTRQPAAEAALGVGLLAQLTEADLLKTFAPSQAAMRHIEDCRRQGWIEVPCISVPEITAIGSAVDVSDSSHAAIGFSISFPNSAADRALRDEIAAEVAKTSKKLSAIAAQFSSQQSNGQLRRI